MAWGNRRRPWPTQESADGYAGRLGEADEFVAAAQHVIQRAKCAHVMAAESAGLSEAEHVGEIEVAIARRKVHPVAVPEAVGEPYFLDPAHIERVDEAGYA